MAAILDVNCTAMSRVISGLIIMSSIHEKNQSGHNKACFISVENDINLFYFYLSRFVMTMVLYSINYRKCLQAQYIYKQC